MNNLKQNGHAFEALKNTPSPRPTRGADEFWDDFRARARYGVQEEAGQCAWFPVLPRWALAMASMALFLSVAGVVSLRGPSGAAANTINSLEVVASHGGVLIMEDDASRSTIVWIMDLENNDA